MDHAEMEIAPAYPRDPLVYTSHPQLAAAWQPSPTARGGCGSNNRGKNQSKLSPRAAEGHGNAIQSHPSLTKSLSAAERTTQPMEAVVDVNGTRKGAAPNPPDEPKSISAGRSQKGNSDLQGCTEVWRARRVRGTLQLSGAWGSRRQCTHASCMANKGGDCA